MILNYTFINTLSKLVVDAVPTPTPPGCIATDPAACPIPFRAVFDGIDNTSYILFYIMAAIGTIILLLGFLRLLRIWMVGRRRLSTKDVLKNIKYLFIDGTFNRRIFKNDPYAGIMHVLIMWDFIILFIGTVLLTLHQEIIPGGFLFGNLYLFYSLVLDLAGAGLIIGIFMAFYRRYVQKLTRVNIKKPEALRLAPEDPIILAALLFIAISGFMIEGLRIAYTNYPSFEIFSFVGWTIAVLLAPFHLSDTLLEQLHWVFWWTHAISVEIILAYFPFSKMAHIGVSPFNMLMKERKPIGKVSSTTLPIKTATDLTIGQLASLDACMRCGRCHVNCPAQASGEPLSPMWFIQDSKSHTHHDYPFFYARKEKTIIPGGPKVTGPVLWACTNCMACVEQCPVWIPHVDIITGMRSALIEEGTNVPDSVTTFLESVLRNKNEWGESKKNRMKWAQGLEVPEITTNHAPLLWYVGCTSCYDPRNQKVAKTFLKILKAANVEFGVLGSREICTGDAVRRVGEETLFRELASENIEMFKESGCKEIVTSSPHSFNAIKNEYPEFDGVFTTIHHTEFIWRLIQEGRITFSKEVKRTITYHDPCYLGRYNNIIDPPREILKSIPGLTLIEMNRVKRNSFCCGGGGGRMFMHSEGIKEKPSEIRVKEAMTTQAENLIVACPWCMSMLTDATKTTGADSQMQVVEISELVAAAMGLD